MQIGASPQYFEKAAASDKYGEGAAERKPEQADELQLASLTQQIAELNARAMELQEQAERMDSAADSETRSEIDHAKTQALNMRAMADKATSDITNAPCDSKTGRKKISASQVAALSRALDRGLQLVEKEKTLIATARDEGKTKTVELMEMATHAAPAVVKTVVARACSTARSTCMAAVGGLTPTSWQSEVAERVAQARLQVAASAQRGWASVRSAYEDSVAYVARWHPIDAVQEAASSTWATVTAASAASVQMVSSAATRVADAAIDTKDYVVEKSMALAAGARDIYTQTRHAIGERMAAINARAHRWMAGIFSSQEEPPVANAPSSVAVAITARPSMGRAMAQAMALSLPVGLSGAAMVQGFEVAMPSLPSVTMASAQFPSLY